MQEFSSTVKPVLSSLSKKDKTLVFKTYYHLMQVKSIAILSTFIKLPFVFKTFTLSIFEWPLKTGFIVRFKFEPI